MSEVFRSKKLRDSARDQPCGNCTSVKTTVSAHVRSVALGSGTGIKAPDFYMAYLCEPCHALVDGRAGRLTREEQMEIWTRAYFRTVAHWFNSGLVVVAKGG